MNNQTIHWETRELNNISVRMVYSGERGAVAFLLFTYWQAEELGEDIERLITLCQNGTRPKALRTPPHLPGDLARSLSGLELGKPLPADLGYHAPIALSEDKEITEEHCPFLLDAGPCHYDGSGLQAIVVYDLLLSHGVEAMWRYLEECYAERFGTES